MNATKHLTPAPDKNIGFSKDPQANTVDVDWQPINETGAAQTVDNMPYKDGQ